MLWVGRIVVIVISVAALLIASDPNSGSIMDLVGNAWGLFGAAFGPVVLLSLFWRNLKFSGAVAGIAAGAVVDALWLLFLSAPTGIYEIIPGFAAGLLTAMLVSAIGPASEDARSLFDEAVSSDQ